MRHAVARLSVPLTAALVLCLALPCARGAEHKPAEVAAARELAKDGIKLANEKKCEEAIEKLARAEALFHAPTILGRLGECQVVVGKLVAGTENLRRVVLEDLGPHPSAAFVAARQRAKKALAEAEPRLARLTITVKGPEAVAVKLTIDQEAVGSSIIGVASPVDPGTHQVNAAADGFVAKGAEVTLAEGKSGSLEIALEAAPRPPPEPAKPVAVVAAPPPPPPSKPSRVPVIATGAVGVVGIGVGAGFGIAALMKKSSLDKVCQGRVCPSSSQGDVNSLKLDGNVATVGFAIGGAGLATALVLFLVTGRDQTPERATLLFGPGEIGLQARF